MTSLGRVLTTGVKLGKSCCTTCVCSAELGMHIPSCVKIPGLPAQPNNCGLRMNQNHKMRITLFQTLGKCKSQSRITNVSTYVSMNSEMTMQYGKLYQGNFWNYISKERADLTTACLQEYFTLNSSTASSGNKPVVGRVVSKINCRCTASVPSSLNDAMRQDLRLDLAGAVSLQSKEKGDHTGEKSEELFFDSVCWTGGAGGDAMERIRHMEVTPLNVSWASLLPGPAAESHSEKVSRKQMKCRTWRQRLIQYYCTDFCSFSRANEK